MPKEDVLVDEQSSSRSPNFSSLDVNEKALLRRIDFRLLPILFIVYLVAFLDRVNISNALTMGLPADLKMKGNQPNIALTIFFVPYILLELPSNILLKKLRPKVWLGLCTISFGVIMLGQGFVKSYSGLLATRLFLGVAEAGVFPGSFYLISFWYKKEEAQKRFTVYWCSTLAASAFGGLLASAIANLDEKGSLENWRWIFILEGLATIIIGIVAYFTIPDFPEDSNWLTGEEKTFIKHRTGMDRDAPQALAFKDIVWFFKDPKRVIGAVMYFGTIVPLYAYAYFAPTIIRTFGYNVVQTQLRSVPPVAAALVLCIIVAFLSDYLRIRSAFVISAALLTMAGLATLTQVHNNFAVQYGSLCLVAMGAFVAGCGIICWYVMNLEGHIERSIGTAWLISFGNTGGIIATFTFRAVDAPEYRSGYAICLGAICVALISSIIYTYLIWREKRRTILGRSEAAQRYFL